MADAYYNRTRDERLRVSALDRAIELEHGSPVNTQAVIERAAAFESYIRNGRA